jgi:death-on-curing protein
MKDPIFLTLEEVLALHDHQIEIYGGEPSIRDIGLLHSAVAMPQASFGGDFLHPTIFEKAAAYLFHLVQNHAFVDGNERIGLTAALAFLRLNDVEVIPADDAFTEMVLGVPTGKVGKAEVAVFLKEHSRER